MQNYAQIDVIDHYSLHNIFIINDIRYNKDFLQFISINKYFTQLFLLCGRRYFHSFCPLIRQTKYRYSFYSCDIEDCFLRSINKYTKLTLAPFIIDRPHDLYNFNI